MKQSAKSQTRRKAAAKKAARPKAAAPKTKAGPKAKATAPRKTIKAQKTVKARKSVKARKPAARKPRSVKPSSIERAVDAQRRQSAGASAGQPILDSHDPAALQPALTGYSPAQEPAAEVSQAPNAVEASHPGARWSDHGEAGPESGDSPVRANKLVPTNAVHTTKRRARRNTWQGPTLALSTMAAVLAILILGQERTPPDVSPLEQRASAGTTDFASDAADGPRIVDPTQAAPDRIASAPPRPAVPQWHENSAETKRSLGEDPNRGLKVLELVEMERMLQRLEMGPSQPDGVVDNQTVAAIRMYQQIAGLPVDGEPSRELLDDMREAVKLLDGTD